jgi:hypothetical protein
LSAFCFETAISYFRTIIAIFNMSAPGKWFYELLATPIINPDLASWGFVYHGYVGFNAFEAAAWFGFCLFVAGRFLRHRKTWYELLYSLSFWP